MHKFDATFVLPPFDGQAKLWQYTVPIISYQIYHGGHLIAIY